jgi:iron complex outermembrane receptor protein
MQNTSSTFFNLFGSVWKINLSAATLIACLSSSSLWSEDIEEIVVTGDLNSLPGEAVDSVFGLNKSILETPRSASTISEEMMDRFLMNDIDELILVAPGTFTQSFFGVAGTLDVRGTPGETYFRGVRRLDNPGNYPTPIGASDRVDIVRGPASVIYGPSKIGGYLNFNPKSARIEETGALIDSQTGAVSVTTGSWSKAVITAEIGGPANFADKPTGYYVYAEFEDSDSFYVNSPGVEQSMVQASFDMDISDTVRIQFGGMYHDYAGSQNAGWNRISQNLIDTGVYVTGTAKPLDTDGDGMISHAEYDASSIDHCCSNPLGGTPDGAFLSGSTELTAADFNIPQAALDNVGTAILDPSVTLIADGDTLENQVTTLYFDIMQTGGSWDITNTMFYESYDNINENAYGFSQYHDSWVFENKLMLSKELVTDSMEGSLILSPSIRYTDFDHADDWHNEYFDRRDLTGPSTALDRRLLATQVDDDYAEYYVGDYLDLGFAIMTDLNFDSGLSAVLGVRWDKIDITSSVPNMDQILRDWAVDPWDLDDGVGADVVDGVSWTASFSYNSDIGLIPYITAAEQSTLIAGQGAEVNPSDVATGKAFDVSTLLEYGVKGSLLDDKFYFALSIYEQERTDAASQQTVTNQASLTEGTELEVRWVAADGLLLTFGYSDIEVENLNTLEDGERFSFLGADDLPAIDPSLFYGGRIAGDLASGPTGAIRAGVPKNIISATATYDFQNGFALSGSVADVDAAPSGYSHAVMLPAYTLVSMGLNYETENLLLSITGKNLTDERYFRANFPNLFGSVIVLPELPRHFIAKMEYKF